MSVLSLTSVGLILCILGAALIVRSFAFASFADAGVKATDKVETAQSVLYTLCAQRVDARFGAPFLITGFGVQLLSALGVGQKPMIMFLVLATAGVAVMYYSLMRDLIATTAVDAIANEKEVATVRAAPKLIESKVQAPLASPVFDYAEATAGA